jgi:hypothetical protein
LELVTCTGTASRRRQMAVASAKRRSIAFIGLGRRVGQVVLQLRRIERIATLI